LAYQGFPTWDLCLIGFIAALFAFAGIHTFNDFVDAKRDVACWPGRPVPSQRLKIGPALLTAVICFAISLILILIFFNPVCFVISIIALVLGCLYSAYLRDRVGYLVLPPIQSMLWLCGWTAFSPDTLFTSWMPWILYIFSIAWQSGHIMIYSPLHPVRKVGGVSLTQVPAFFVTTSPMVAAMLGFIFLWITLGLGLFLGLYAGLGLMFLIPVGIMGLLALASSYKFLQNSGNFKLGIKAFQSATYFMLVARVCILLSILIFF
jgi:4-hydroxybenzoate polyprenyltransferase